MRANAPVLDEIREAFADTNVEIINIGDSVRARRIIDGVQEGHNILNVLADHEISVRYNKTYNNNNHTIKKAV